MGSRLEVVSPAVGELAQDVHRGIFGSHLHPDPVVAFYPYVEGRSQVKPEGGRLRFRLNAALQTAPDEVLRGILGLLLCRVKNVPDSRADVGDLRAYRQWMVAREGGQAVKRGRKHIDPVGEHRSLLESYLRVTLDMGLVVPVAPRLSWSKTVSGHRFGHWDADHRVIVVSQILDDPEVPEFVLDYVVYHEILHILHPVRMGSGTKRIVHSAAFRRDERRFARWREGDEWIEKLARRARRERR